MNAEWGMVAMFVAALSILLNVLMFRDVGRAQREATELICEYRALIAEAHKQLKRDA